jgi:hypothetical protein
MCQNRFDDTILSSINHGLLEFTRSDLNNLNKSILIEYSGIIKMLYPHCLSNYLIITSIS